MGGATFRPGEDVQRTEGALPGLGEALTGFEAERMKAGRQSLAQAAQTGLGVAPIAAQTAREKQAGFGEALGMIRAGEQPYLSSRGGRRGTSGTGRYWF
jgi:hypothetical protein